MAKVKPIVAVTYRYSRTGKMNKYGNPEYKRTNKRETKLQDTSFRVLGQKAYSNAKKRKDTYVTFAKPKVQSVTRRYSNGDKTVTYYRRAK